MLMPGRKYSIANTNYRFGFNGKENDNDIENGAQDYGMRIYDGRLGRFLSVDPLTRSFAMLTPYQFASNTPIQALDLDGAESMFGWSIGLTPEQTSGTVDSWNKANTQIVDGTASGVKKSIIKTWSFITSDAWKAKTWNNAWNSFGNLTDITVGNLEGENDQLAYNVIQPHVDNFKAKVINGDAYSRAEYFSEFGTDLAVGALLDKGFGKLGDLKVFTNAGKTFQSASIRFTQNTVNKFGDAVKAVGSGKYAPIDIVKMTDGMYSTIDNTRLLAAQRLGLNIKATVHAFDEALPKSMLDRFENPAKAGEYATTWGQAVKFRTANQTGGFVEKYGSNGTFVQPTIKSH